MDKDVSGKATVRLYEVDSHMKEFDAKILKCEKNGDLYDVVLDRTAFFPEGGGQAADTGRIDGAFVSDVKIHDGVIHHKADSPLKVGENLHCVLDFEQRFRRMQNHSGEHILSGLIHRIFGYDNIGFHMGHEDVSIDFNGILTESDVQKIELLANRAVTENVSVICEYPMPERLAKMSYRSKLNLSENVRIVTIEGYDCCACCAPHVSRTGEIGIIKLLGTEKNKGGTRIHFLCGFDALDDYNKRYHMIAEAAQALSVKQSGLGDAFRRLSTELDDVKSKNRALRSELFALKMSQIEPTDGNLCLFEEELSNLDLIRIMNEGVLKCGGVCAVFTPKEGSDSTFSFVCGSRKGNMKAYAARLKEALGAKCGGTDEMIQGCISAEREKILKYFDEEINK